MSKNYTLFILTRDFRTSDALTLYQAYEESVRSKTKLSVIFRFDPNQISTEKNPYYCPHAVTFMIEALEELSDKLPFQWIEPISDEEWKEYLLSIDLHKIFIARDFTPYPRKRFEFYQSIVETIEVDDISVFPISEMKPFSKLAYFITFVESKKFPSPQNKNIQWNKVIENLPKKKFIRSDKIDIILDTSRPILHPKDLPNLIEHLGENIKGYSNKKIREQVGTPKVSYLSAFIKFGMISIREIHEWVMKVKGPSIEDKKAFERELYFRDFYYTLAWYKPEDVFDKPTWQQKSPKFISKEDLLRWKKETGKDLTISEKEEKEIEESKKTFENWSIGNTEYPSINAGMNQLIGTGYMLNRLRMLTTSYLTQDHGLWWKYPEQFFANYLTDYDWTINSMNHQNIAKIGLYPKYTLDFSISRQEKMNVKDKEKYIEKYK
jgi:deoxyribodipyrimidine photolyase